LKSFTIGRAVELKPKVTLGICVHNCEQYIKDAIQSILIQDFPHESMSLIFVDDGSNDGTLSVIEEYVSGIDMPVEIIQTPWKGIGHARNVVLSKTCSKYVIWIDGDMVLSKNFVKTLVNFMEQHSGVGITKGKQSLDPGANLISTLEAYSRAASRMLDYQSKKARSKALGTGGSIYRVEAMRHLGGFDENLRYYGEDWDFEIRLRDAGWTLCSVDVKFFDYERRRLDWKGLWRKYWLRGYYSHYFFHKNCNLLRLYRMVPFAASVGGLLQSLKLYRLTKCKSVFLLPIHALFKMSAWYLGYVRSHLDSYEPC
jgi:glycosyltransferase involved in cell wall biosynthesis